jgi:hypothetical protein
VSVDLDRAPAEGTRPLDVGAGIPAHHRLAALAETVHVEDHRQVVQLEVRRVLERFPHGAFSRLAVAVQDPDAIRQSVQVLARERHADAIGQPLAERAGGDVDPRNERRRMTLEDAPELPIGQELLVRDRADGSKDRVKQRGRMPLREDQAVVRRLLRVVEVVSQVVSDEHRHQVRSRHARRRVPRLRSGGTADRIDAVLLAQLAKLVRVHLLILGAVARPTRQAAA